MSSEKYTGAFEDTEPIKSEDVPWLVNDLKERIEERIDLHGFYGLGSTRKILEKEPDAKPESKDIDLLLHVSDANKAMGELKNFFKELDSPFKTYFGNVFSAVFELRGKTSQVDLMLSDRCENSVDYLRTLRFWNDVSYDPERPYLLKGLHRTELIRFLMKSVGLSMTKYYPSAYKWNGLYKDKKDLISDLKDKKSRSRKNIREYALQILIDKLESKSFDFAKEKALGTRRGNKLYMKNRYNAFNVSRDEFLWEYPTKVFQEIAFEKVELCQPWDETLAEFFNAPRGNLREMLQTFDGVLFFTQNLLERGKLSELQVRHSLKAYKEFLERKPMPVWNVGVVNRLRNEFPFAKDIVQL